MYDYDLLVIGAGSGGVRAARKSASYGAKVAVIEYQDLGGTCVNVGCVPKKLFVYASHFKEDFEDAEGFGWTVKDTEFDWQTLLNNKNNEISRLNNIYKNILEKAGVEIINGFAAFKDSNTLVVENKEYTAKHILIAAGGKPFVPDFPGSEHVITSNDAFFLEDLPKHIVIVGGGYISVEFAGIFHGLGVEVTQLYRRDLFLRGFDQDLRQQLAESMILKGVDVRFNNNISSIEKDGNALLVTLENDQKINTDCVMYATGRVPNHIDLGLNNTKIELNNDQTIKINEEYQTSDPSIFALGDITGGIELTPVATAEAMKFASCLFDDKSKSIDYENVPSAVFSQPNLATVGLTEEQANDQFPGDVQCHKTQFRHMKHTISGREERIFMKLVVQKSTDKVIGAHMLGNDAGEIIQGLAIAIRAGATKEIFDSTIGIHPTAAEEFVTLS